AAGALMFVRAVDAEARERQSLQALLADRFAALGTVTVRAVLQAAQSLVDLADFRVHLPIERHQRFSVLELHGLLGEIRRQRLVAVAGMAGDAFPTFDQFLAS